MNSNVFQTYGLEWKTRDAQQTFWELYNNPEIFKKDNAANGMRKIQILFKKHGHLVIQDTDKFLEGIGCPEKWVDFRRDLASCFYIGVEMIEMGGGDSPANYVLKNFPLKYNESAVRDFVLADAGKKTKEYYYPGFRLKKIFNETRTLEQLTDQITLVLEISLREVFDEVVAGIDQIIEGLIAYGESPVDPENPTKNQKEKSV